MWVVVTKGSRTSGGLISKRPRGVLTHLTTSHLLSPEGPWLRDESAGSFRLGTEDGFPWLEIVIGRLGSSSLISLRHSAPPFLFSLLPRPSLLDDLTSPPVSRLSCVPMVARLVWLMGSPSFDTVPESEEVRRWNTSVSPRSRSTGRDSLPRLLLRKFLVPGLTEIVDSRKVMRRDGESRGRVGEFGWERRNPAISIYRTGRSLLWHTVQTNLYPEIFLCLNPGG